VAARVRSPNCTFVFAELSVETTGASEYIPEHPTPRSSELVFVGEQPGDEEDRQGYPFVGPSGKLPDRALAPWCT
jgi:uracil-DNA glycosylase family 4